MDKKSLEKLKQHDIDILYYLYRFRFLTTYQLQKLLSHSFHSRVNNWLSRLYKNNFIKKYDNKKLVTLPTLYSLGTNGRKYLKDFNNKNDINKKLLSRVWREYKYSDQFKKECTFIASLYLTLIDQTKQHQQTLRFFTKVDLSNIKNFVEPSPSTYFSITDKDGPTRRWIIELFTPYPHPRELINRVNKYYAYYRRGTWQRDNKNPFPRIIFIAPDPTAYIILKGYIKKHLGNNENTIMYLSLQDEVQKKGISIDVIHRIK